MLNHTQLVVLDEERSVVQKVHLIKDKYSWNKEEVSGKITDERPLMTDIHSQLPAHSSQLFNPEDIGYRSSVVTYRLSSYLSSTIHPYGTHQLLFASSYTPFLP
jgi:hypothetical protein